jgi:photosystem II stability/assembly factor-like uncharacterized protein
MKKLILLTVISIVSTIFVNAQTWRKAYETPILPITYGCMSDQNTAWLVASSSFNGGTYRIYKSTDLGITWKVQYQIDSTKLSATDIFFVNSSLGFSSCSYGNILKTSDGGNSWQILRTPDTTYQVTRARFFDNDNGFALCTKGTSSFIYKTTDGGTSWTTTATIAASMLAMEFYSPTSGIATGNNGNQWYTTDGSTWTKAASITYPPISYSRTDQWGLKVISATTAISCGWGSTAVGYEPTIFLKTTDGGANWNCMVQTDANKTYVNFKSIYFRDTLNGIAVGGSTYPGTVICKTSDAGTTWIPLPSTSGFSANVVMGYNDNLIVAGGSGDIIISSDFGNSWTISNKYPTQTVSAINIINNNIYACGNGGVFFKSTDAGSTFDMHYITAGNKSLWSKGLFFLNENLGYACSQKGQALKTTDAGNSWTQVIRDTSSNFISNQALYFINENVGFVAGNIASNVDIIYKTTDGGSSWSSVQNLAFQNLNCISFADASHGVAGGNKSAILFTTDQGVSWSPAVVNTTDQLAINGINFYDGMNGIAVGSGILLKTTDGGATWNKLALPVYAQNATLTSACHDSTSLYAVGNKYCLKSTDLGNSWSNIMDTVYAVQNSFTTLNSIALDKSGNIWIAGGGGILTNSTVTSITKDGIGLTSFNLEQNYPNPFNPSTKINFSLNRNGFVKLKLFDVLGRVVREIYKGEMTAGHHQINFNAGNLASGTYIYSLQVNDQFTCRKMTLLK